MLPNFSTPCGYAIKYTAKGSETPHDWGKFLRNGSRSRMASRITEYFPFNAFVLRGIDTPRVSAGFNTMWYRLTHEHLGV